MYIHALSVYLKGNLDVYEINTNERGNNSKFAVISLVESTQGPVYSNDLSNIGLWSTGSILATMAYLRYIHSTDQNENSSQIWQHQLKNHALKQLGY